MLLHNIVVILRVEIGRHCSVTSKEGVNCCIYFNQCYPQILQGNAITMKRRSEFNLLCLLKFSDSCLCVCWYKKHHYQFLGMTCNLLNGWNVSCLEQLPIFQPINIKNATHGKCSVWQTWDRCRFMIFVSAGFCKVYCLHVSEGSNLNCAVYVHFNYKT